MNSFVIKKTLAIEFISMLSFCNNKETMLVDPILHAI